MIKSIGFRSIARRIRRTSFGDRKAPRPFRYAVLEYPSGLGGRMFVKTYSQGARIEFLRGQATFDTGKRSGLFLAPTPLELIESRGIIIWEYLEGLTELRQYIINHIREHPRSQEVRRRFFFGIGRVLAALHEGFPQIDSHGEFCPIRQVNTGNEKLDHHVAEELSKCPRRPLHWDFSCGNLFLMTQGGMTPPTLVVLDTVPNHYILPLAATDIACPIYIDIAQMIFSLCCHPEFSPYIRREVDLYVDQFLMGYSSQAGFKPDRATAWACAAEVGRIYEDSRVRHDTASSLLGWVDSRFRMASVRQLAATAIRALPDSEPREHDSVCG